MSEITREFLADALEEIVLLLELKGENPFKLKAYKNGAEIVRNHDEDIVALAKNDELKSIKGIGDALAQKLHELATTGELEFLQKLKAEFPPSLFELFDLNGLGPKKIKALYDQLQIDSIDSLRTACEQNKVAALAGFGKKTEEKILAAIAQRAQFASHFRLGEVAVHCGTILDYLREHIETLQVTVAGSYRRGKETLHDLDFLVATSKPIELIQYFCQFPDAIEIISEGETKGAIRLKNGLQCDLRAVSTKQFPFALQYFSGSKEHNVALRQRALKKNLSLNEYGFTSTETNELVDLHIDTEEQIYQKLGLQFIEPELRENRGEIEAAEAGQIPRLIQLENLRGTFHNHTTASDGAHTLKEMANAAAELGLQYLGISDHSKSSFQANGLNEERLLKQIEEIRLLNSERDDITIFAGSEVDILKDGSLDFDDSILAQLDYVVASVHNVFNLSEDEMTARFIKAMENPHVTMIGHLTGRLLLKREPYAINHDKIIDCAAETGTMIELNCSPRRFDMDWRWWKKARDKGVLCSINPDAHHINHLQFLHYGIVQARKGWLRKEDVFNTKSVEQVRDFFKRNR